MTGYYHVTDEFWQSSHVKDWDDSGGYCVDEVTDAFSCCRQVWPCVYHHNGMQLSAKD